jgi:hypothetical protein
MKARQALTAVLLVALVYVALACRVLGQHGWDPVFLVRTGGYDGQFAYRFALDPLSNERTLYGITLDRPAYRQQRILYPFLVWMVSLGGRASLVPASLLAVNLLAICVMAAIGAAIARDLGLHGAWGAAFALYPGFMVSAMLDLNEIVAGTLLLAGLLMIRRQRIGAAAALLALAVLARETTLLAALAYLPWAIRPELKARRMLVWAAPLVTYAIWQIVLRQRWGEFPIRAGEVNMGAPLMGLISFVGSVLKFQGKFDVRWLVELSGLAMFAGAAAWAVAGKIRDWSGFDGYVSTAWLLYGGLALAFSREIWSNDWAFLRALSEFYLLGVIVLMSAWRSDCPDSLRALS